LVVVVVVCGPVGLLGQLYKVRGQEERAVGGQKGVCVCGGGGWGGKEGGGRRGEIYTLACGPAGTALQGKRGHPGGGGGRMGVL